jgi:hypothetical protein
MAHEIDTSKGFAAMAYIGDTPWHGLGQVMAKGASIEQWQTAAGMDFSIQETPVYYKSHEDNVYAMDKVAGKKVLVRSDTRKALAVVSKKYQVVQPQEVLEFYRDLTAKAGFDMETAGVLRGGTKYWALASMGQEAKVLDDTIKGYLLLGTACDGSMATTAMFTSVRVVCNNTLGFAMQEAEGKTKHVVRVSHRSTFDEAAVKAQLGIAATSWDSFIRSVETWSSVGVNEDQAKQYFDSIASYQTTDGDVVVSKKTTERLMALFNGQGKGSQLSSAKGTVWGLVNAVTEFVDHHRGRTSDVRIDRAWFGDGQSIKLTATALADDLVAAI